MKNKNLDLTKKELKEILYQKNITQDLDCPDEVYAGVNLFAGLKLMNDKLDYVITKCDKGILYSLPVDDLLLIGINKDEAEKLASWGWIIKNDHMAHFV